MLSFGVTILATVPVQRVCQELHYGIDICRVTKGENIDHL
jgi:hypothetical protein